MRPDLLWSKLVYREPVPGDGFGRRLAMNDQRQNEDRLASAEDVRAWPLGGISRLSPFAVDLVVSILVFGSSVVNVAAQDEPGLSEIPAVGFLMLALGSVALFWRRIRSSAVLGVGLAMTAGWVALGYPGNPVFHILASVYAVGRFLSKRTHSGALLAGALVVVASIQMSDGDSATEVATALVVTALPWYVGRRLRLREYQAAVARERAEHLEWKRTTEAQRAIADARAGIARELHDVVAHNVSVMTVQASVARLVALDDPSKALKAISAVEEAGRRALDELRHLLGVLRPETASGELGPQPALDQVHELVDQLRVTGMSVTLEANVVSELSVRTDLFAYRIVQEALTNALKHGGVDCVAFVRLNESDGYVTIEVTNTQAVATAQPGSGRGIAGMRERATLLAGTFEAGPRPEGGFRVLARLPIGDR